LNDNPDPDGITATVRVQPDGLTVDFHDGYRLGWHTGWHGGYAAAEREMEALWHAVWLRISSTLKRPTYAELRARRGET
jgi:hypothetical protein